MVISLSERSMHVLTFLTKFFSINKQQVSCLVPGGNSLAHELRELGVKPCAINERCTEFASFDFYRAVRVSVDLSIPTQDGESLEMTNEGLRIATLKRGIPNCSREYWKTNKGARVAALMGMDSEGRTEYNAY
jgi:hypothetical protein